MTNFEESLRSAASLTAVSNQLDDEGLIDEIIALAENRLAGQVPEEKIPVVASAILGQAAAVSSASAARKFSGGNKDRAISLWKIWNGAVTRSAIALICEDGK